MQSVMSGMATLSRPTASPRMTFVPGAGEASLGDLMNRVHRGVVVGDEAHDGAADRAGRERDTADLAMPIDRQHERRRGHDEEGR